MKKIYRLAALFVFLLFATVAGACSSSNSGENNETSNHEKSGNNASDGKFPVTLENAGREVTFNGAPERVIALYQQEAELMAALDLEDTLVGYSMVSDNTPKEYVDKLEDVPVLAENGYPSQEVLLEPDPDFLIGSERTFLDNGVGTVEELDKLGINAYVTESEKPETIENMVYKEIEEISRIFGVEERGEALIVSMEDEINEVTDQIEEVDNPVKVFYMTSPEAGSVQTTGGVSLDHYLIELAGGKNIFEDEDEYLFEVSWEEVIDRDPDVIVMSYCCGTKPEDLEKIIDDTNSLKDVTAVKNKNYIAVEVEDTTGNVRVIRGLKTLSEGFYPDQFDN